MLCTPSHQVRRNKLYVVIKSALWTCLLLNWPTVEGTLLNMMTQLQLQQNPESWRRQAFFSVAVPESSFLQLNSESFAFSTLVLHSEK